MTSGWEREPDYGGGHITLRTWVGTVIALAAVVGLVYWSLL